MGIKEIDFNINSTTSTLKAILTTPSNKNIDIFAFLRGDGSYCVRFIPKEIGVYRVSIGEVTKSIEVTEISKTPKLKLSDNKEYLELEKKPFFWLSDTWWMALCGRLNFEEFKELAKIRKNQGFNVIQLVAGLFPDMDSFDIRGANRGGFAWKENYKAINPAFFDEAEEKIKYLYSLGFHIALVGSWGYYLEKMGLGRIKEHWRYLIARWGVYSSIYIAAGEASMPYYLSTNREAESESLKSGWSEVLKYIKKIDKLDRILTIHPIDSSLNEIKNVNLLDINLLQASHGSYESVKGGVKILKATSAKKLSIMDEINYEGILRDNYDGVIRLSFWKSILNNSKGFGYGANGIWQVNRENEPFGKSPSGAAWGDISFKEAINFKGARDLAKSKEFLEDFEWWKLKSVDIIDCSNDIREPSIATIDNKIFIAYFYNPIAPWDKHYTFTLEPNSKYSYFYFCPNTYHKSKIEEITTNSSGKWQMSTPPSLDDWILVIELKNQFNPKKSDTIYNKIKRLLGKK
jgi:hypothetical protein